VEWWAKRYGVSRYSVVDLLAHVGEDCAGAIQLAVPDRVSDLIGLATVEDEAALVDWLDENELELRLRELQLNSVYELLRESSTNPEEDCQRFFDAVALDWLIAATDAHGKNYSLLHATGPQLRLAPLYDIITILPYPQLSYEKSKLAMSVGGERQISRIEANHWLRLAKSLGLNPDNAIHRIRDTAARLPNAVDALDARVHPSDYMRTLVARLGEAVVSHARRCLTRL
jgi:serine/threonine protein kinase HipA of HipAB toxin-antitoxin module